MPNSIPETAQDTTNLLRRLGREQPLLMICTDLWADIWEVSCVRRGRCFVARAPSLEQATRQLLRKLGYSPQRINELMEAKNA